MNSGPLTPFTDPIHTHDHSNVLGSSHRLFKLGLGDVAPGLDGEKLAFRLDTLSEFGEEGGLARGTSCTM